MTDEFDQAGDEEKTVTLRRLIHNAERLSRGPATPQHLALEQQFEEYQRATKGLSGVNESPEGYDTGEEDPEIGFTDPPRFRPGERGAIIGKHLFGVRGASIGGELVDDLVLVNSRRLEFTVPEDASPSGEIVLFYEPFDWTGRGPEMDLSGPTFTRPTAQ